MEMTKLSKKEQLDKMESLIDDILWMLGAL